MVIVEGLGGIFTILGGPDRRGLYSLAKGDITLFIKHEKLKPAPCKSSSGKHKTRGIHTSQGNFKETLSVDLHGCTVNSSLTLLADSLSRALLENYTRLEIIHGIGAGILRETTKEFLSKSPHVREFFLDPKNPGTTICYF